MYDSNTYGWRWRPFVTTEMRASLRRSISTNLCMSVADMVISESFIAAEGKSWLGSPLMIAGARVGCNWSQLELFLSTGLRAVIDRTQERKSLMTA